MAPVITSSEFMPGLQHVSWDECWPCFHQRIILMFPWLFIQCHYLCQKVPQLFSLRRQFLLQVVCLCQWMIGTTKTLNGEIFICMEPMNHAYEPRNAVIA